MRKLLCLLSLFFLPFISPAKEIQFVSFELKVPDGIEKESILRAVESADFNCYRFFSQRRSLFFDNGAELVLYSVLEIQNSGKLPVSNCYLSDSSDPIDPVLSLHPSGIILILTNPSPNYKTKSHE